MNFTGIQLSGQVSEAVTQVLVNGMPVAVVGGKFQASGQIGQPNNVETIQVTSPASGLITTEKVTVNVD